MTLFGAHAATAAPRPSPAEVDCLAQAVYYEARGESAAGQRAVAQVVVNRTRAGGFPRSICKVIHQGAGRRGCQFSFACGGALPARREAIAWARSRFVAAQVLGGAVMKDVAQAIAFHVASLGPGRDHGLRQVAHIGGHVFFARYTIPQLASAARVS